MLGGADIERRPRGASHEARSKEMASLTDRAIAGKIAMGDIRTGEQTIPDYLIKPLNRAKEARVSSHV